MKVGFELTKKSIPKIIVIGVLLFVVAFAGFAAGFNVTYQYAHQQGFSDALTNIQDLLSQKDISLTWTDLGDGRFNIQVIQLSSGKMLQSLVSEFHLLVQHFDKYGNLVSETYHPMTTTDFGKDWIEQQIFSDVNYTNNALWLATSNDEDVVDTAWVILPNEITTAGLLRDVGSYVNDGVGKANVTLTFGITDTISTCLYGLYADSRENYLGSLIAAEQQGSGNRKNMNDGDSLKLTVQWSVTDA